MSSDDRDPGAEPVPERPSGAEADSPEEAGFRGLGYRLATAGVLIPSLIAMLYLDPTPTSILVGSLAVALVSQDEYLRMVLPATKQDPAYVLRVCSGLGGAAILLGPAIFGLGVGLAPALMAAIMLVALGVTLRPEHVDDAGHHLAASWAGLMYVPVLASIWTLIKGGFGDHGAQALTVVLCITFMSDGAAYFAGKGLGKHPLAPRLSPNKTVEGSLGGFLGGQLGATVVGAMWLLPELGLTHGILLGLGGSLFGQIGDLVESTLKRAMRVKDASQLLPGHGGMLDRIDSLLFVAPFAYFYLTYVVGLS